MVQIFGTLYVIAAPSGAGKTTLVHKLVDARSGIRLSISHTTRAKRAKEKEGVDYFFVDDEVFDEMITSDQFLEYAIVFGYLYGTTRAWVDEQLTRGVDVILEIDWQGAQQIRRQYPGCVTIFILPPTLATLKERLSSRGQDDDTVISSRLAQAHLEISHFKEFDYLIVNDDLEQAFLDLQAIVDSQRLKRAPQTLRHEKLLQQILQTNLQI